MSRELFIREPECEEHPYGASPSFERQYHAFTHNFERQSGGQIEAVLRGVESEVISRRPRTAILEAAPLYALPNAEYPDQSMDHPAAMAAMDMTNRVVALLRSHSIPAQHWLLLDDVNNGSNGLSRHEIWQQFLEQSGSIPIYNAIQRIHFESDFQSSSEDTCSSMDAGFQREKIRAATYEYMNLEARPLFINIHPSSFRDQQRMMLERLRNSVKGDPYAKGLQISKKEKNDLSLTSFLHIWTDTYGNIELSRPVINSRGVLEHENLVSL